MSDSSYGIDAANPDLNPSDARRFQAWAEHEVLSVTNAALLVIGCNPNDVGKVEYVPQSERPCGYQEMRNAIRAALVREEIEGHVELKAKGIPNPYDYDEGVEYGGYDPIFSMMRTESLKAWLAEKQISSFVFDIQPNSETGYLDQSNPRYSLKLAAVVAAWEAMEDESLWRNRSPKKAMKRWLEGRADQFGLRNTDGSLNNHAIEQISAVANWQTKGGAPKTS